MTIGDVIKKYCDEHKMSYRKFAIQSNVTSGYLSMLINNRNNITNNTKAYPKGQKYPTPQTGE